MSFGEILTKLRKEKGMSQEDLASELNVSRQAVSKWESNNSYPETDKIIAICRLFNCSMDELIGLKEGTIKKENKTLNVFNKYFDLVIKGIKLFYSMTFKQKIKCLFEMAFYVLMLFCFFILINSILIEIFTKLLYLLPNELLVILVQTFKGILYLLYLIIGIYILVKLYRVRYLDYYEEYSNNKNENNEEIIVKEKEDKKLNIKDEKIIIRDPQREFKLFAWLKSVSLFFVKSIAFLICFGLATSFVILIACTIFVLYFIDYGLLIVYVSLGLIGAIIAIYVILEILIKFIFGMRQYPKRLFIMFILAMLIVGISGGFFACELTTYKIVDNKEYNTLVYKEKIEMQDKLIINFLYHNKVEIVYEERDNILVEFYGTDRNLSLIETLQSNIVCGNDRNEEITYYERYMYYNYHNYFNGDTFNDIIRNLLKSIKNKEIVSEDVLFTVIPKIHISRENYDKLMRNYEEYQNNSEYYWCEYE